MGKLQKEMTNKMLIQGYAQKTVKLYTACVRFFAYHFLKSPLIITTDEIELFFLYLREQKKAESTIHIYYESLKYFYTMHKIENRLPYMSFRHINNKLPEILSQNDVCRLLTKCSSLKYRTIFSMIYSAGLRVSEAANLKLSDINFERKQIFIRNSKNNKDRYTILADETISLLAKYFQVYNPIIYVFYSTDITKNISIDCIQKHFHKYAIEVLNNKTAHVHTLRHCFATHLLENGTNIFYIMKLLGHSSIQTTLTYLHMQELDKLGLVSPIDNLKKIPLSHENLCLKNDLFLASA